MQFDNQADIYDKRTGLGQETAQKIALSIEQMLQPYLGGRFLEIGAGTGEIGYFLQNLSLPYTGIDLSKGMLDVYRQRFKVGEKTPDLIQMDGNTPWPVSDKSISVFFSSRAMHQLDAKHVLEQLKQLSFSPSSLLILGNVKRPKSSPKSIMRKEMHKVLNDFGLKEKSGQSNRQLLFDALELQGGEKLPPVTFSRWQVSYAPIDSLMSWEKVDGIAGQAVDLALKKEILNTLKQHAEKIFSDLHTPQETEESYELNAIKLPY